MNVISIVNYETTTNRTETWYGSALAVKYTDTLFSTTTARQNDWVIITTSPVVNGEASSYDTDESVSAAAGTTQDTGALGSLFKR